ncbi:MAG: cysteine peptidase family C39 domain-containing protein [Tannerellaceae bacterium]|nr:cysteine peptidase family C39 domain-containing protein [Tannerellaceae bacterium]
MISRNENHFVVLYRIKNNKYYIVDPSYGYQVYSEAEFKEHWLSIVPNEKVQGVLMKLETTSEFYEHNDVYQKFN